MKKYISLFLCLTCILTLVACGKKAAPIQLPQTSDITSVDVTVGENTTNHSDTAWISEIISDISSSEPTSKQSVQDFPQTESYIKIDFQFETGTSTIFAYEENGKHYIEQPYQGIYKIDSQLYERLQEIHSAVMFPGMTAFPCPHFVAASASSTLAILSAAVSFAPCLKKPDTTRTEFPIRISVTQSAGAVLFMLCLICSFLSVIGELLSIVHQLL